MLDGVEYRLTPTRDELRFLFLLAIVLSLGLIGYSWLADPATGTANTYVKQAALPVDERDQIAPPRDNTTVITGMDSPFKATKAMYAFNESGVLVHYSNESVYGDVDPTDQKNRVLTATHPYFRKPDIDGCEGRCSQQFIVYVNLSTGEHDRIYNYTVPGWRSSNWHDVDHLGGDRYLVAGLNDDNAYVVNTSTGLRTWQYDVQTDYKLTSGGPFPKDWTHLNDVNVVQAPPKDVNDTWYMLSLRNQDQVIFVDPDKGLRPKWTLGCDDCHDILFEQHNPDYIPRENGGPALLVSDSENNRIVEYQWNGSGWEQSWMYTDSEMSWPRDADRLPNGHTLITDSHGSRVFEVDRSGEIVWQVRVVNGYDAERLGTGDESSGGPSAVKANLTSVGAGEGRPTAAFLANEMEFKYMGLITKFWHSAQFIFPVWVTVADLFLAVGIGLVVNLWLSIELYWRGVRLRSPVSLGGVSTGAAALNNRLPEHLHVAYLFAILGVINGVVGTFAGVGIYQWWAF